MKLKQKRNVVSCSFGKDSLAAVIVASQCGIENISALYCRVMFDEKLSVEMPEHEEFIFERAIPILKKEYGIETEIITPAQTVVERFYRERRRGKNIGKIYGWPTFRGCWISGNIKLPEIRRWKKENPDIVEIVGIAADEGERTKRKTVEGKRLILCEQGITEEEAAKICYKAGLISPIYSLERQRSGCWFCPCQRTSQLKELRERHPELWKRMLELDKYSPFSFKPKGSVQKYELRFQKEDIKANFWKEITRQ